VGQQENGDRADSTTGLNKRGQRTKNYREKGSLEVERGRASYMVAEVGQQENGDRAYSTTGLNKRRQRTMEKEGAWRLREGEHHTW
jgi:hypothetical protein